MPETGWASEGSLFSPRLFQALWGRIAAWITLLNSNSEADTAWDNSSVMAGLEVDEQLSFHRTAASGKCVKS